MLTDKKLSAEQRHFKISVLSGIYLKIKNSAAVSCLFLSVHK